MTIHSYTYNHLDICVCSELKQQTQAGPEQNSDKECVFMWCYTEQTQGLLKTTKTFTMQSTHTATTLKS